MTDTLLAPDGQFCRNCRFYLSRTGGLCRRFPPQMVPWPTGDTIPIPPPAIYWPSRTYPRVSPDDWCGEWVVLK